MCNAYVTETQQRKDMDSIPEFGEDAGKYAITVYSLKSAVASFRVHLVQCMHGGIILVMLTPTCG